jgi:hypothetical protein
MKDNWPSMLFAIAGGVVLSVGNLCTQYAWAYVGLSITEVIVASMVVVIGKFISSANYSSLSSHYFLGLNKSKIRHQPLILL